MRLLSKNGDWERNIENTVALENIITEGCNHILKHFLLFVYYGLISTQNSSFFCPDPLLKEIVLLQEIFFQAIIRYRSKQEFLEPIFLIDLRIEHG